MNESMQMKTVNKVQFGQFNDKRFYISNGIASLPYGHPSLEKARKQKMNTVTFIKLFKPKRMSF